MALTPDDNPEDSLSSDEPGLAALYSASVRSRVAVGPNAGSRVVTLGDRIDGDGLESIETPRCASFQGFSVHANCAIGAHDRLRLERLIRYASRPAISPERLSELPGGRLLYRLKRRWSNGTTEVVFERADFIAKLAALVPAPRAHWRRIMGCSLRLRSGVRGLFRKSMCRSVPVRTSVLLRAKPLQRPIPKKNRRCTRDGRIIPGRDS